MLLYNGLIYDGKNFHDSLVTEGRRIKYVGDAETAARINGSNDLGTVDSVDLKGRLVLPGFIDSHAHGGSFTAMGIGKIDLSKGESVEEYKKIIKEFIETHPDRESYSGFGWQTPLFGEEGPTKELLDNICSDRPILIRSGEGHALWANSAAIRKAGITAGTPDPKGGVIGKNSDGSIRGTFKDEAQGLIESVIPEDSVEIYKEAIMEYQRKMVKYGYTSTTEMMMKKGSNLHKAYRELAREGKLLIKTQLTYLISPGTVEEDLESVRDREEYVSHKIIDGRCAKIFIDGVVESATAWLKDEYSNDPGYYGEPLWEDERLFDTCIELDQMGYDIHFHVIGDRAVAQMTDAVEAVIKANGPRDRRPVAAHVQLADPIDIERMGAAGISVSANPYWFFKDEVYSALNEYPLLGARADHQYPMRSLIDAGIVVSAGSDYSITPEPYPLMAIRLGMERTMETGPDKNQDMVLNPGEKVGLEDMVKSVTVNGAYTIHAEGLTGSLTAGKLADMVVLDKNIFNESPDDYEEIKVCYTISEGEIVYREA